MARVLVVCQLDGFANSIKPAAIERYLSARGHDVRLVDTYYLSRASAGRASLARNVPAPSVAAVGLFATELASRFLARRWRWGRQHLSYPLLLADYRLRRRMLGSKLQLDDVDVLICETPHDAGVLTLPGRARTLYDCPTPWADELGYEGRLTRRQHRRLRRLETSLYESVDFLAFHWESYARYAVESYGITGRNLITLNFGCTPGSRARFGDPPRIVYLGSLGSSYIDLPLLSRLSRLYPHLDVYGGPAPDPRYGLNYLGYASPAVLDRYQLGLITSSKDELRRSGFSAKHMDYLAHGLPVLVPAWRRHLDLLQGSVPYDEDTFLSVVEQLSCEDAWQQVSDKAYEQAQRLTWEQTLRPLDGLISVSCEMLRESR